MDLSDCDISGIAISGGELRNARVNLEQAAQLGVLLAGVVLSGSGAAARNQLTRIQFSASKDFSTVALSRSVAVCD